MNDSEKSSSPPEIGDRPKNLLEGGEDFVRLFSKGADFLREVVQENQRLRFKLASIEAKISDAQPSNNEQLAQLAKELESWKQKYTVLLSRIQEVEEENKDFLQRYMEVEEENNNLANLYIASYQLHSTLNFNEVLQIILEIVINLIGAETFAIYLYDGKSQTLSAVAAEGLELSKFPQVGLKDGEIGKAVAQAEMLLFENRLSEAKVNLNAPIAIIPLQIKDNTIGAIVVFKLLQQKSKFLDVDRELFHLLAGHAATAIFAAKLYTQSERKLTTMQGFIDLLTK